MIRWLKNKIEIHNRRDENCGWDWTGDEQWSLGMFITVWLFYSVLSLSGVVMSIIRKDPIYLITLLFESLHIWQICHLLFSFGPEYDNIGE